MNQLGRVQHFCEPLSPEQLLEHYGTSDLKEVGKEICRMGQRDLQAKFHRVYKTQSFSNNNSWLRRKLLEAAGIQNPKTGRVRVASKADRQPASPAQPAPVRCRMASSTTAPAAPAGTAGTWSEAEGDVGVRRTKRARKPALIYPATGETSSRKHPRPSYSSEQSENEQDAAWFPDTGSSRLSFLEAEWRRRASRAIDFPAPHNLRKRALPEPLFPGHNRPLRPYSHYYLEDSYPPAAYPRHPAFWANDRVVSEAAAYHYALPEPGPRTPRASPSIYAQHLEQERRAALLAAVRAPRSAACLEAFKADRVESLESCHWTDALLADELPASMQASLKPRAPPPHGLSTCSSHTSLATLSASPHRAPSDLSFQPATPSSLACSLTSRMGSHSPDNWYPLPPTAKLPGRLPGQVILEELTVDLASPDPARNSLDELLCSFDGSPEPDCELLHMAAAELDGDAEAHAARRALHF